MTTTDGMTVEERGGPEATCDGGTCYHGCSHVESAHAEEVRRLRAAAAEALAVLAELTDSTAAILPLGLGARIDSAKARLAGVLHD